MHICCFKDKVTPRNYTTWGQYRLCQSPGSNRFALYDPWHGSELPWRSVVSRWGRTPLQLSPIKRKVKSVLSAFKFVSAYYKVVPPTTEREPLIDKLTSDLRSSTLGHLHHLVRRTSSYDFAAGCVLMCILDSFKTLLLMYVKVVDSLGTNCMVIVAT
jgi:hypothetical protein